MVSTRSKASLAAERKTLDSHISHSAIFQILISQFASPQGVKAHVLKSLHYVLMHMSSNTMYPFNEGVDINELILENSQTEIRLSNQDLCRFSNMLFQELCKRYKQLFSSITYDVSRTKVIEEDKLRSDVSATAEEFNLLLRCCLTHLNLLKGQQQLLRKNGEILLTILRSLSLICSSEGGFDGNPCNIAQLFTGEFRASLSLLEPSDTYISFIPGVLEVFLDELLAHEELRKYIKMINSLSSTCALPFMTCDVIDNFETVIEVMCSHFSVSLPNEQALQDFLNELCFCDEKSLTRAPELSLHASVLLLYNPVQFSAPKLMQSHVFSLISKSICTDINCENQNPNSRQKNFCVTVLEKSVDLYIKHLPSVMVDGHLPCGGDSFAKNLIFDGNFEQCFQSYLLPARQKKLSELIAKHQDSWCSSLHKVFCKTRCQLAESSIAYVKESEYILDAKHRDATISVLSCIILRVSNDCNNVSNCDTSFEDVCILASILKLMGSSLLNALQSLNHKSSTRKEYNSILRILAVFGEFNFDLPIQKYVDEYIEEYKHKYNGSKRMLLHFIGLLSLSFVIGIEFFVKGCISVIMILMNLFVYEEGNLDAYISLVESQPNSASVRKGSMYQKRSIMVASNFQNLQSLHTLKSTSCTQRMCNRQNLPETLAHLQLSEFSDFIELNPDKDYKAWSKNKSKFRKWKCKKLATKQWERKKRTWNSMR